MATLTPKQAEYMQKIVNDELPVCVCGGNE